MIDRNGALHIQAERVNRPCEECGGRLNYPNLRVEPFPGLPVVLCRECLERVVEQMNAALKTTSEQ